MYGTNWCPDTMRAKQVCKRRNIEFAWFDIDTDPEACAYVESVNKGQRRVPTIVFPDGKILVEPSDSELEACLGQSG